MGDSEVVPPPTRSNSGRRVAPLRAAVAAPWRAVSTLSAALTSDGTPGPALGDRWLGTGGRGPRGGLRDPAPGVCAMIPCWQLPPSKHVHAGTSEARSEPSASTTRADVGGACAGATQLTASVHRHPQAPPARAPHGARKPHHRVARATSPHLAANSQHQPCHALYMRPRTVRVATQGRIRQPQPAHNGDAVKQHLLTSEAPPCLPR